MIVAVHARLHRGPGDGQRFEVSDPPPRRGYYVPPGTLVVDVGGGGKFVAEVHRYNLSGQPAAGGEATYEHAGQVDP